MPMTDDDRKKLEENLVTLGGDLKKAADEVKKVAEKSEKEVKELGDLTAETKKTADEALMKHNELIEEQKKLLARFEELEQKAVRRRTDELEQQKTIGDFVVDDEGFKKNMSSTWRGQYGIKFNRKDIMSSTATVGTGTSPANSIVPGMRVPGIVQLINDRRLTVRDLLAPGQTSTSSIEYARENVFTNLAGVVSEGATKPQSDITFELETAPVRTIAHYFKASRQILDDAPGLRSYINARAEYGLKLAEENELLNGDGTGQHIHGLIPNATAYSAAFTPESPQIIDTLRLAILQVFLSEFPTTGVVLHPTDWARIQLTKDGEGRYILGNPVSDNVPRVWNLPLVETQAMAVDKFLVGAFNLAAQIFDRLDMEILMSTENEDDFIRNMITIRCEERLALAVYRPAALVYGDFGGVT